ncbi:MAG: GNAT family N-acetyltransferase [Robiginitalea sp.]
MQIIVKTFQELDIEELYKLLQLRSDIFVVEQDCVFLDPDDKDQSALHVLGWKGRELVAYARIFGPGEYFEQASIGRVAVKKSFRGRGYGVQIMQESIKAVKGHFGTTDIALSAQKYLEQFYRDLGFSTEGKEYMEDGIPHVRMVLQ